MNPVIVFMKKRGVSMLLPLLLLMTACDEPEEVTSAGSQTMPDLADLSLPEVTPDEPQPLVEIDESALTAADGDAKEDSASDTAASSLPDDAATITAQEIAAQTRGLWATDVPEPTMLVGLAAAAIGCGTLRRKKVSDRI